MIPDVRRKLHVTNNRIQLKFQSVPCEIGKYIILYLFKNKM